MLLQCEQQSGDVLFLPDFFGHATINLEPTVAIASEFAASESVFFGGRLRENALKSVERRQGIIEGTNKYSCLLTRLS